MSDLFEQGAPAKRKGMGGHETPKRTTKDEWLTPPHVLAALGEFDLDPCAPIVRPWPTAREHFTEADNGLWKPWRGRVWCNPPYADYGTWLGRLAEHGNGIALIFARTETEAFFEHVWSKATGLLFLAGRLTFHHVDGRQAAANSGAPSVLIAYGRENLAALYASKLPGAIVTVERLTARP